MGPETVWTLWRSEKDFFPCRESNSGRPTHSLVTILSELSRLHILW